MYNQPFFIPNIRMASMPMNFARFSAPTRGVGLFSRLGNIFGGLKNINWGGFINNASKTLGVINQTIPLVRQVGPMMNNMRSIIKVASIFKDETDKTPTKSSTKQTINNYTKKEDKQDIEIYNYDNSPTFFINS